MHPKTLRLSPALVLVLLAALTAPAAADVYSCTGDDGSVVYRQTPCPAPAMPPSDDAETVPSPRAVIAANCDATRQLAFAAARLSQSGMRQEEVQGAFGGADGLAPAAIGVIEFVTANDTAGASAEAMAALAAASCASGALPELECEDLPANVSARACTADPRAPAARRIVVPASTANSESLRTCREPIEQEIEAIDRRLQARDTSTSPEDYRARLMELTDALRACAATARQ